ncbi:MAG: cysteine-rich CWC family protein [Paludibacteraceae bacterium]|nr:cysteine-rich CWC family protein [Paludibacteraceae bacterium]
MQRYPMEPDSYKNCPRCGAGFLCQHNTPAICQCAGVYLSRRARQWIAMTYPGQCLCRRCLEEIGLTYTDSAASLDR